MVDVRFPAPPPQSLDQFAFFLLLALLLPSGCHRRAPRADELHAPPRPVHVPKRRGEVFVSCELLDAERGCTPHCEVRAERVAEDVKGSARAQTCALLSLHHPFLEHLRCDGGTIVRVEDAVAAEVSVRL